MTIFNNIENRANTYSIKWDMTEKYLGYKDLLPLWVADSDFKSPPSVLNAIEKRAKHGIFGYTSQETNTYYNAVKTWYEKTQNLSILEGDILFSPGVVPGINACIQCFTKPNDAIVIQTPVYFPFENGILNNNRKVYKNSLINENGYYTIDFTNLENLLKKAETKMMIFCSPHNPIGRVWTKNELEKISNLCLANKVLLISDEIHSDLVLFDNKHIPIWNINNDIKNNSIILNAPSKTFNIAGLQLSQALVHSPILRDKFSHQLHAVNGFNHPNCFAVVAAIAAYTDGYDWLNDFKAFIESQMNYLDLLLKEYLPKAIFIKPEATYLAWINLSEYYSDTSIDLLIKRDAKVAFNDGASFGQEGLHFQRINVSTSKQILEKAIVRTSKILNK